MRGVEVVHHVAAAFRELNLSPAEYREINVEGRARSCRRRWRQGVRKFVNCSTCGVHGNVDDPPGGEDAPIQPADYYQQTKYDAEPLVLEYVAKGLKAVTLRPAAIFGPGDLGRFRMIFQRLARGWFPMFGDGQVLYHPLYIDNFLDAFVLSMQEDKGVGQAYLIADAEYVTIEELVRRAAGPWAPRRSSAAIPCGRWSRRVRGRGRLPAVWHRAADLPAPRRLVPTDAGLQDRQGTARTGLRAQGRARRRTAPGRGLVQVRGTARLGSISREVGSRVGVRRQAGLVDQVLLRACLQSTALLEVFSQVTVIALEFLESGDHPVLGSKRMSPGARRCSVPARHPFDTASK